MSYSIPLEGKFGPVNVSCSNTTNQCKYDSMIVGPSSFQTGTDSLVEFEQQKYSALWSYLKLLTLAEHQ